MPGFGARRPFSPDRSHRMPIHDKLIRERCSYKPPVVAVKPGRATRFEWRLADRFRSLFGRFEWRPTGAGDSAWVDVFGRDVHLSEFAVGRDFAVACLWRDGLFEVCVVRPGKAVDQLYATVDKVEVRGLSADDSWVAIQVAQDGNWSRPEVVVLDLAGRVVNRIAEFEGVSGCFAGPWAPGVHDRRLIVHHEAIGFLRPVLWSPSDGVVKELSVPLEGEVLARWDTRGSAWLLERTLDGRSDLHRLCLRKHRLQCLQPLDGTITLGGCDDANRAVGLWSAAHAYRKRFQDDVRIDNPDFAPSAPLTPWTFRRIAGVPCFVVGEPKPDRSHWTIFDGYGDYAMHYSDTYWPKVQNRADHGYLTVMVNTRGCSGFGRAWREGTAGDMGHRELEDLRQVRDALVREGVVDPERTIITGESWGGYLTLLAMGVQPELWKIGVAGIPVGDWEALRDEATPIIFAARPRQFGGGEVARIEAYRKASPLTYVDRIRGPILMLCGKHDSRCPPKQNLRFAEKLRAVGGECWVHLFDGGHGAPTAEEFVHQQVLTMEFLAEHCQRLESDSDSH